MPNPHRDYLTLALNQYWFAPPVALWRAIELRVLAAATFAHPILDLGCGDGLIAQVLFENEPPVEAGFDPWLDQVRKAPASGAYRHVQQALGDAMPYPGGTFATVFSNSVLEHIPDLAPVLREAARVLKPGGRFLATVPSDAFRRLLAGYQDRAAKGDLAGAEAYAARVDARLEHHRYPSPQQWSEMLESAGMRLVRRTILHSRRSGGAVGSGERCLRHSRGWIAALSLAGLATLAKTWISEAAEALDCETIVGTLAHGL